MLPDGYSGSNIVACIVPSNNEQTCPVTVRVNGEEKFYEHGQNLQIKYLSTRTPILAGVIPNAGVPGQRICFHSKPRINSIHNITEMILGNYYCNPYDEYENKYLSPDNL